LHTAFRAAKTPLGVLDEFRAMVKALHRAGIELILMGDEVRLPIR
jgi:pullulanase/glycogen debranching enzyme